jgi:hypothetical protein
LLHAAGKIWRRRLFEPLGYTLEISRLPLDDRFPEWGESPYIALKIAATTTLQKLLTHLYVLIPVLDNEKHYWVGEDEIEKLLKRSGTVPPQFRATSSHPGFEQLHARAREFRLAPTRRYA